MVFLACSAGLLLLSLLITTLSLIVVESPFGSPIGRWIAYVAATLMNTAWISAAFSGLVDGNPDFAESVDDILESQVC